MGNLTACQSESANSYRNFKTVLLAMQNGKDQTEKIEDVNDLLNLIHPYFLAPNGRPRYQITAAHAYSVCVVL